MIRRVPSAVARRTDDPGAVPHGWAFRPLRAQDLQERSTLMGLFTRWEPPRRGHAYVLGVDVSDGLGKDRAVVDVHRIATVQEPAEQVAQFVHDRITPSDLAYVVDAIGHHYTDDHGLEALAAIETNNHGLSTQDTLQLHLGYRHFYRWEIADAADPAKRFTPRIGWYTTVRTRPMILDKFFHAVTTLDPVTGKADLILNSAITLEEMAWFQTEGELFQAEAAPGKTDDTILAGAIANYVQWRLAGGEIEPLADRRRRHHEQQRLRAEAVRLPGAAKGDFRNMPYTEDELEEQRIYDPEMAIEEELETLMDVRGVVYPPYYDAREHDE